MRSVNEKPCLLKKVGLVTVNAHQVVFKPTRGYKVRGVVVQARLFQDASNYCKVP